MDVKVRAFCEADIAFALAQTSREGWDNTDATFRVCLGHDPGGCFVAEVGGRRAGMVTSTCYGRSAWVGNLIVAPDFRRRGIGQRLMEHAFGRLEEGGVRTFWLEADPMGVGLYERLGFVAQFESPRFAKRPPHRAIGEGAERQRSEDLPTAMALDARCFGDDRERLLRTLYDQAHASYCVRRGGEVAGFAMVLPSAAGVRLGPCVVAETSLAGQLIESVLADFLGETVIAAVPGVDVAVLELFTSRGFARQPSSLRMLRGRADAASSPSGIIALANGAMG